MTTFDKREKSFEDKHFHDEELEFRITSRSRKLLGLWASEQMNRDEEDAERYAMDIVRAGVDLGSDTALAEKLASDLDKAGLNFTAEDIMVQLEKMRREAEESLRETCDA